METFVFIILLLLIAFFAASETAIFSVTRFKLHSLVREKRAGADYLARLKANPNRLLATVLIGSDLVTIFAASLATFIATAAFGSVGIGIATGLITLVILIFGESVPKSLAAHNPVPIALFAAPILMVIGTILSPVVILLEKISSFFTQTLGVESAGVTEEELKAVIAISAEAGVLGRDAAEIMENVIEFEDVRVGEVMTPEVSVVYLNGKKTLREAMATIGKTEYSRFPVFEDNEENIIGVLDVDHLLREIQRKSWDIKIKELANEPFIVPENKKVADLLADFTKHKIQFALVVDEHGSYTGVVSLEDVLEEIVGDIFDKSLKIERLVRPIKKGGFEIEGKARVADLERLLHVSLKGDGFTTLAGLIETQLGRIPQKGEKLRLKNFEIAIEDADSHAIRRVHLYHLPPR